MVEFLYQSNCAVVSRLQILRLFALAVTSGRKCNITDDSRSQLIDLSASRGQTSRSHSALVETITKTAHNYADRAEAEEKEHIFIIAQANDDIARYRFSADKLARFRRLIDM